MVLALLAAENRRRLARQTAMYAEDAPLWRRYERACDFLEDDLESGYVRVLQEMIAAGWSTPDIGAAAREMLAGWYELLTEVATEASDRFGGLGPFSPAEAAVLVGNAFIGAEALLLLGFDRHQMPIRASLRRVGELIRAAEERSPGDGARGRQGEGSEGDGTDVRRRRRAGRRAAALGGVRRGCADDRPAADVVDRPLPSLEVAGALPRPPPPGRHVRRARLRPVGPPRRPRRLRLPGVRRRRPHRARRHADRSRGGRRTVAGCGVEPRARRRRARPRARRRLPRAVGRAGADARRP